MRSSSESDRLAVRGLCAAAAALTLVGCASGNGDDAGMPDALPRTSTAAQPGAFVGECGSLTDGEVYERAGMSGLKPSSRNGIKCRWEADGGARYVMFTWYRGSPIDRERSVAQGIGHEVHDLDIAGHRGFPHRTRDSVRWRWRRGRISCTGWSGTASASHRPIRARLLPLSSTSL